MNVSNNRRQRWNGDETMSNGKKKIVKGKIQQKEKNDKMKENGRKDDTANICNKNERRTKR